MFWKDLFENIKYRVISPVHDEPAMESFADTHSHLFLEKQHKSIFEYARSYAFVLTLVYVLVLGFLKNLTVDVAGYPELAVILIVIFDLMGYFLVYLPSKKSRRLHVAWTALISIIIIAFEPVGRCCSWVIMYVLTECGFTRHFKTALVVCHAEYFIEDLFHFFVGLPLLGFFFLPAFFVLIRLYRIGEGFSLQRDFVANFEVLKNIIRGSFDRSHNFFSSGNNGYFAILYVFFVLFFFNGLHSPSTKVGAIVLPLYEMFSALLVVDIFFLIELALWTWLLFYIYCCVFGFKNYRSIYEHFEQWVQLKNPFDLTKAFTTCFILLFQPFFWWLSGGVSVRVHLGHLIYDSLEYWIIGVKIFLVLTAFFAAVSPLRRDEETYVQSVYYFSCTVSLYFVSLCALYNWNVDHDKFIPIFTRFELSDYLGPFSREIFSFAYDYITLALCTMTAVVFSFIFLSILFSDVEKKKVLFSLLLFLEITIILAFLNVNILGFFIFFEATIAPTALLIFYWGASHRKVFAMRQFVIYSVGSSIPLLASLPYFYSVFGTLDYLFILNNLFLLTYKEQLYLWLAFFILFAVKVPLFPFHSWLLNAHVEAPTVGSIILAALLLKFGIFGMVRYLLGFLHNVSVEMAKYVIAMALVSLFFASICSITETDVKKLVAYTSIAHMSLAVMGLFVFDPKGFYGALITMIAHGVISTALFYLIGVLYSRVHTRDIIYFGGLVQLMPLFSTFFFYFLVANSGFPCSLGFVGEMLVLQGVFNRLGFKAVAIVIVSLVLLLYANLRLFMYTCFGTINTNYVSSYITDVTHLELFCLAALFTHAFLYFYHFNSYFFALFIDCMGRHFFH